MTPRALRADTKYCSEACKQESYRHRVDALPDEEKEARRDYQRKRAFGIDRTQYNEMLKSQDYACAICKITEIDQFKQRGKSLCVDHDHKTGEVRGILCDRCNSALGLLKDDPVAIIRAAKYLYKYHKYDDWESITELLKGDP